MLLVTEQRVRCALYSSDPVESEAALQRFLNPELMTRGIEEETSKIFGKERGRLRAAGLVIGDCDLLIGATALRHNLILLTNNRCHFERIEGLRMESVWTSLHPPLLLQLWSELAPSIPASH